MTDLDTTLNPDRYQLAALSREPWRPAYDAFCEAMDWTGEEPAVVPLFGRDE